MKIISFIALTFALMACQQSKEIPDHLGLGDKLTGSWKAAAFDGELHEAWQLKDGAMEQQGYYIEKSDTSYSAKTRIEKVGDDIILYSVIKNSNPKIFKAVKVEENELIFENTDYKNPFRVHYKFIDATNYQRTITGYEKDTLISYEFRFLKHDN